MKSHSIVFSQTTICTQSSTLFMSWITLWGQLKFKFRCSSNLLIQSTTRNKLTIRETVFLIQAESKLVKIEIQTWNKLGISLAKSQIDDMDTWNDIYTQIKHAGDIAMLLWDYSVVVNSCFWNTKYVFRFSHLLQRSGMSCNIYNNKFGVNINLN